MLALLMAGTSWAVASWVSPWLVLPYLILMTWLLLPQIAHLSGGVVEGTRDDSNDLPTGRPDEGFDDPDATSDVSAPAEASEGGSEPGPSASPSRARRGKGRPRKTKAIPEPTEAAWIQVAPGKFIRVEASEGSPATGPHPSEGGPVAVPTTPHLLESEESPAFGPIEGQPATEVPPGPGPMESPEDWPEGAAFLDEPGQEVGPAFDPVEGFGDQSEGGGEESESCSAPGVMEWTGSSEILEGPPAADGIAPQSGGPFEAIDERWPVVTSVAEPDGAEGEDERSSSTGALADVPTEESNEWGVTDPTEITVDETDFDDAGPCDEETHDREPPKDAEPPDPDLLPDPSKGSASWPWRLAPRAGTRVGHPLRTTGREASPRRLVRSSARPRQPLDPRRASRRGARRPRQITRTLPPRSPPPTPRRPGRTGLTR